jgi:hypothetical protein
MEDFAAELAEAAYPLLLRNSRGENWLDLELELWQTMRKTVGKWAHDWPQAGVMLVSPCSEESQLPRAAVEAMV